jgi:mRNA-degrading endonuclease RelE of RelBE toxin-antitoxin system
MATAAKHDLAMIGENDPDTEAEILAILQEIKGNQQLLDALTIKDFGFARDVSFHVDKWVSQHKQGRNLWRLKIWNLEDLGIQYRIVYALDPRISRYYILAVLHRDFDYDEKHPRVQQLNATYDRLGIPSFD